MSLDRFNFERRLHIQTGLSPLILFSGSGQSFINDATGASKETVYKWNREYKHKYYTNTNIPITGNAFTGGY